MGKVNKSNHIQFDKQNFITEYKKLEKATLENNIAYFALVNKFFDDYEANFAPIIQSLEELVEKEKEMKKLSRLHIALGFIHLRTALNTFDRDTMILSTGREFSYTSIISNKNHKRIFIYSLLAD